MDECDALALACCRWHHDHKGGPVPCVNSAHEADALRGLLASSGQADPAAGATYLGLVDLALTFPPGDYRDGIVRASQFVLTRTEAL